MMIRNAFQRLTRVNIAIAVMLLVISCRDCTRRELVQAPVDTCAREPVTIHVDDIARAAECAQACERAASRTTFLPKLVAIRECEDACGVAP